MNIELFISEKLEGYMKGDVEVLINIKASPTTGFGGLNFPLALYVFSCMDYLGFLTTKVEPSSSGETKMRIIAYIEQFFPKNIIEQIHSFENIFVDYFRHGLTHEYFPKATSGISKDIGPLFQKVTDADVLILNSHALGEIFCQSIDNLITSIRNDSALSNRIVRRIQLIEQKHSKKIKGLPDLGFISTLSENFSGASGVNESVKIAFKNSVNKN